jgi:uncharacterized membrane protein
MSQFLVAISVWLHAVATVIFIGHFLLLALIYLPAVQDGPQDVRGTILSAISKRSRPWLYASLLVFAVTGLYLMLADPNYLGIGNFRNPWSIAMLLKHVVILVMIGIGFWFNALLRVGPLASSTTGAGQAIARFRAYVNSMAISGVAVLLLTALAQSQ